MNLKPLRILTLCLGSMWLGSALAAPTVQAKLDSVHLLMGKMTTVHVTLTQPKNAKVTFPLLQQVRENGVIPVCGDSVELRAPARIYTVDAGANLRITYDVPVQAFDSGYYHLPEFAFVDGKDTIRSKSLALKVVPVLAEANTPIHDYASTADPENPSIFDAVPDWVLDYWWILLILVLAIVAFVYGMRRYRREGSILPKKPVPTPYEQAISGLQALKEKKLWEQGMEKEYFTELTEILRRYLFRQFGINAIEMTSRQILGALSKNDELKDKRAYFRQILDMADFVKFAKVRPLPDDNVLAYDNAVRFVRETKPKPVETQEENTSDKSAKSRKGTITNSKKKKGGKR